MSSPTPELAAADGKGGAVRLGAVAGATPLGAIFGGIGVVIGAAVAFLGLDRLPLTVCVFKGLTGLPCPTCGSTRALARLFGLDVGGALGMNPLVTIIAVVIAAWALADLVLLPQRRAVRLEISPRVGLFLRATAFGAFFLNWVFLLVVGR